MRSMGLKIRPLFFAEYVPSLDAPDHNVMEDTGGIEAGLTGHDTMVAGLQERCQLKYLRTSLAILASRAH